MNFSFLKIRISNLFRDSNFGFRILTAVLVLAVLPLQGWTLSITDLHKEYLYGDYEEAIKIANDLRENDQVLYYCGLCYVKLGDYPKARIVLRRLVKRFPNSQFYEPGMIKIADTYFLEKDYSRARQLYLEIEKRCSFDDSMPLVLLRLVQVASRRGEWGKKAEYIKRMKSKYPKANEMRFIKVLESLGDFFTIQLGAFSVKKNAFLLVEELKDKYSPYIVEDKKGSYPLYKVRVGRFKSRYDAENVLSRLLNEGYPARIYP
jgi:tetratricopeptide (TPR) repeat protein